MMQKKTKFRWQPEELTLVSATTSTIEVRSLRGA